MKKLLFSFFVLLTFISSKCEDDTPKNPIDLLPPATQIGANTFGCLVDGEAFTPDRRPLSFTKGYVPIEDGYALEIKTTRYTGSDLVGIGLIVEDSFLNEQKYSLEDNISGNSSGLYIALSQNNYTSSRYTGELSISKHDSINYIISGTFWFDVQDHKGVVHQIREGRFDIKY
jgi:hypothetical protein